MGDQGFDTAPMATAVDVYTESCRTHGVAPRPQILYPLHDAKESGWVNAERASICTDSAVPALPRVRNHMPPSTVPMPSS